MLSFLSICGALFLSLVLFVLYRFYFRPYRILQFYKKQGGVTQFYPGLLSYPTFYADTSSKGDFYYHHKQLEKANPNLKFIAENFGSRCFVSLLDTNMIKEMLQKYDVYQRDTFFFGVLLRLSHGTSILAEGAEWKKGRRIISSAFNFEFLKHQIPMIVETTQQKFDEWIAKGELKDVEIVYPLGEITGEITGKSFFGKNFGNYKMNGESLTTVIQKLLTEVCTESFSPLFLLFGPGLSALNIFPRHRRMNRDILNFRKRCGEIIQEIDKSAGKENSLLSNLLHQRKIGDEDEGLTNEQIIGEFAGLFAAGTETTSHLVNSAIYFLCKNPEMLEKVKEEIKREFNDIDNLTIDNVNRMNYLSAVMKETLRLGGPIDALFYRNTTKDDELCGIKIKKGTLINVNNAVQYTSPKYYNEPNTFRPERWLNESDRQDPIKSEPYGFLPFSAGPRNCVGQHLAIMEAKIITALLVKRFDMSVPKDYNMILVQRFMYEPYDPIRVTLVPK